MNHKLAEAVLNVLATRGRYQTGEGKQLDAVTETDLAQALREQGWRLPRNWLSEVQECGFSVTQPYYHKGGVKRVYSDGRPTRSLPDTCVLISL